MLVTDYIIRIDDTSVIDIGFVIIFVVVYVATLYASQLHDPLLENQKESLKTLKTIEKSNIEIMNFLKSHLKD